MKLVMDEKLKHRLVGVSVILSLGAIFLPAMMKKSSQRLENNLSVNVQLPPKPVAPNVAVTDEEQMFKTIKVAKLNIAPASQQKTQTVNTDKEEFIASAPVHEEPIMPVAKAELTPVAIEKPIELALNNAAQTAVREEVKTAPRKIKTAQHKPVAKPAVTVKTAQVVTQQAVKPKAVLKPVAAPVVAKRPAVKREIYAVQLASFSQLANAQALVHKLQAKGYKANYARVSGKNGAIYKVYVGHSPIKDNVVKLKTQLASAMQLNGFVVNTGVS